MSDRPAVDYWRLLDNLVAQQIARIELDDDSEETA